MNVASSTALLATVKDAFGEHFYTIAPVVFTAIIAVAVISWGVYKIVGLMRRA